MMGVSISTYNYDPKMSRAEKEEIEADIRGQLNL